MSGIREQVEVLYPILGVDLSALNAELITNRVLWLQPIEPWREMSTTAQTATYDLRHFIAKDSDQKLEITRDNVCDGMLSWASFKLADGIFIDTRCREFGNSWANSVHLMERVLIDRTQTCTSKFQPDAGKLTWKLDWSIASA